MHNKTCRVSSFWTPWPVTRWQSGCFLSAGADELLGSEIIASMSWLLGDMLGRGAQDFWSNASPVLFTKWQTSRSLRACLKSWKTYKRSLLLGGIPWSSGDSRSAHLVAGKAPTEGQYLNLTDLEEANQAPKLQKATDTKLLSSVLTTWLVEKII